MHKLSCSDCQNLSHSNNMDQRVYPRSESEEELYIEKGIQAITEAK